MTAEDRCKDTDISITSISAMKSPEQIQNRLFVPNRQPGGPAESDVEVDEVFFEAAHSPRRSPALVDSSDLPPGSDAPLRTGPPGSDAPLRARRLLRDIGQRSAQTGGGDGRP